MALADNKAKIQALLAGINALPEADSGEPAEPVLQEKAVTPTKDAQSITPDAGYDGLSQVNVGAIPEDYIVPSGTVDITANGTHDVREAESVNVNVPAQEVSLQEKTVTPTESDQTVTPDSGYDGLSSVSVGAISNTHVGSAVPKQEAQTITPTTSEQTAVASGVYTTGDVKVAAIPADYVIPTGEKSITANGTHDVAGFASVNVAVESGGSGVTNVDTCSFTAKIDGLPASYDGIVECCWTEYYEGVFEYCQDGGGNMGITGYPVCNTVLGVWWGEYSAYTSSVEVSGAEIIHQTENGAIILMPAEPGSSVDIAVTYSR